MGCSAQEEKVSINMNDVDSPQLRLEVTGIDLPSA